MPIRTLLYEDDHNLREALDTLFSNSDDHILIGAFGDCMDILNQVESLKPDVVLMDIELPGMNGIEGVSILKKAYPQVEALMLTVFDDDSRVFDAVCAGANGYLLKKVNPLRILEAISEVSQGGAPMTPFIARKVLQLFPHKPSESDTSCDKLSAREMEVMKTLSKGFSYKMVAEELNVTLDTVRTHTKRIYIKLHVHSVTEAISKVFRKR